jgi:hypothetical protein
VSGIPFLVVAGGQDNLVNSVNSHLLASSLDAPLMFRLDAGHGITDQYAAEVNLVLEKHIVKAANDRLVEGALGLPETGIKPGRHPWRAAAFMVAFYWLVARKATRWWPGVLWVGAVLRMLYGPLWQFPRRVRMV